LWEIIKKCKIKLFSNNFRKDFDTLEFILGNLESQLLQTIDGCVLYTPPKIDILKAYSDVFNTNYLLVIQNYWNTCYENMSVKINIFYIILDTKYC
jgi:hypothetical protein